MSSAPQAQIDVRRADDRFKTNIAWLDSKHSFSFSRHWDPANIHHGLLLVNNDDIVTPGAGFETHPHRDMEIVTWVLEGSLVASVPATSSSRSPTRSCAVGSCPSRRAWTSMRMTRPSASRTAT